MKPDKQVKNSKKGQWKKGESGNPNGRPRKELTLTSMLRAEMGKVPEGEKSGKTHMELIALSWLTGARHIPALLFELLNRLEGKSVTPLEHTGKDGGPISLVEILHGKAKERDDSGG